MTRTDDISVVRYVGSPQAAARAKREEERRMGVELEVLPATVLTEPDQRRRARRSAAKLVVVQRLSVVIAPPS